MAESTFDIRDVTMSEVINTMGTLHLAVQRDGSNPVLESMWIKLRDAASDHGKRHPEELARVEAEIEMQGRFQ